MESFSTIRITEKAPGAKMLPVLFWYLKVCRAVLIAIHSEFCYSIFIKTMFTERSIEGNVSHEIVIIKIAGGGRQLRENPERWILLCG